MNGYSPKDKIDLDKIIPPKGHSGEITNYNIEQLLTEREMMLDILSDIHDNIFRGIEPIVDRDKLAKVFEILRKELKKK